MTPQEQEQMDFLAFKCRVYEDQIAELTGRRSEMNEGEVFKAQAEAIADLVAELRAENKQLRAELERADEAADALEERVEELERDWRKANEQLIQGAAKRVGLEAELYAANKTIALQDRILTIREGYLENLAEAEDERDKYRAELWSLVDAVYESDCSYAPAMVMNAAESALNLLCPDEEEEI